MAVLKWDEAGKREYETGVSNGVLFVQETSGQYKNGVAWSGLVSVQAQPEGGESNKHYADNIAYVDIQSAEEWKGTIEAFTYPDEFAACDGSKELAAGVTVGQQARQAFGLVYVTKIGNDTAGTAYGERINIVYGLKASPSERSAQTINESPEPTTMSWSVSAQKQNISKAGYQPTATVSIKSTTVNQDKLKSIKDKLFGTSSTESMLPTIDEIIQILES